jgi:hypothetical protein
MIKLKNNARGFLASAINDTGTTLTLTTGTGANFPDIGGSESFFATIVSTDGTYEIVNVTARVGDVLTIARGAESTSPLSFNPGSLVELRVTVGNINSQTSQLLFREYRPGDAPTYFTITNAITTNSVDGNVVQFTSSGTAFAKSSVPLQPGDTYNFRVAYRRIQDSGDPANDGITAGMDWYNGANIKIGESILHSNNNLTVASGRVEFDVSVGLPSLPGVSVYAPESARYGVAWFRTFGNLHKTNLEICGLIAAPNPAPLVIEADDIVIPVDFQWPAGTIPAGAGVSDPYSVARTFYVTMAGSDAQTGTSLSVPLATIGAALTKAAALGVPAIVIVQPGEYLVQPNTEVPINCALYGYDLRVTKLILPPGLQENNMFLMNSGIKVRGFTFSNLQHEAYTLDSGPPTKGFAFVFKPGATIIRSPYISDCSVLHNFTQAQLSLPIDKNQANPLMPRGGGNIRADGSVLAPSSPLRSCVVDSFTAINPNGVAYVMVRNAFVQLVSVFTNWSRVGLWCHEGGQVTVANSNSTFGDYAFASTGFRLAVRIEDVVSLNYIVSTNAADLIDQNRDDIIDEVYAQLFSEFVAVQNFTQAQEDFTRIDLNTMLVKLEGDFRSGQDKGSQFFVKGLFNWNAAYFFDVALLPIFLRSYDIVEARILARPGLTTADETMLAELIALIKTNVETPVKVGFSSVVEATGQQFSNAGSGVNYNSLPFSQRGTGRSLNPLDAIYKRNGGSVYSTFSTESGDTYLGEDLRVDFERSTIEGQAFSRGVQNIALPLIIGIGG